jgi:hypothetical protein
MLSKAVAVGLNLKPGALDEVHAKAHAHGRLYNERKGLGVFYRYYPRFIAHLCRGQIPSSTSINIHHSVFTRIERFTGHYAPGHLPSRFSVVDEATPSTTVSITNPQWEGLQKQLGTWTMARSWLYGIFLDVSLFAVGAAFWLWIWPLSNLQSVEIDREGVGAALHHLADILKYFLPVMFDNLITLSVVHQPLYLGGALLVMVSLFILRWWVRKKYHEVCYALRTILLAEPALRGSSFKGNLGMQVTSHENKIVPS